MGTSVSPDGLHRRRNWKLTEIRCVPHPDFEQADTDDTASPTLQVYRKEGAASPASLEAVHMDAALLKGLQQGRLLTAEGERHLFRRMNLLRYRAQVLLATLHPSRPSRKKQLEIDRLLLEADDIRSQIAEANLRLVASIAGRLSNSADDFDEFVAEGNAILLNAIDLFDFSRGYRFSTYATHAIQRRLYRLISQRSKRARREHTTESDVFSELTEPEPDAGQSSEAAMHSVAVSILNAMEETLDEREQLIVRARFGLDGTGEGKTLRNLADQLGLSKERIRQLLQRAIGKLADASGHLASELVA